MEYNVRILSGLLIVVMNDRIIFQKGWEIPSMGLHGNTNKLSKNLLILDNLR